jgi:hypothetical protein
MRLFFLPFMLCISFTQAFAAYDGGWYRTDWWSGEYPNGFSVVKRGVSVPGRSAADPSLAPTIKCELPYKAVFHQWNTKRRASFVTQSRIVPMRAKESFDYDLGEGKSLKIQAGETVEYLVYGSEGWFRARYNGLEFDAFQDLFDRMEEVNQDQFHQDEWIEVSCINGGKAWLLYAELFQKEEDTDVYLPGLDSWSRGFVEYGRVRDLRDSDLNDK